MLEVEDAPLAVAALNDDPKVEIVQRGVASLDSRIDREIEVPLGAPGRLVAGGNVVVSRSIRVDAGRLHVRSGAQVDFQAELDIVVVVGENVEVGGGNTGPHGEISRRPGAVVGRRRIERSKSLVVIFYL